MRSSPISYRTKIAVTLGDWLNVDTSRVLVEEWR